MENHSLDKLFRQGLESGETSPPSASWAQMEALLDASAPSPKRKNRPVIWFWAAAAMLPFLVFFWWIYSVSKIEKPGMALMKNQKTMKENPVSENEMADVSNQKYPEQGIVKTGKESTSEFQKNEMQRLVKGKNSELQEASKTLDNQIVAEENPKILELKNEVPKADPILKEENKPALANQPATVEAGYELASIEFRKGGTKPSEKTEDLSVASIEWRKSKPEKLHWSEKLANLKSGQIKNLPTMNEAKENIIAFLGFSK